MRLNKQSSLSIALLAIVVFFAAGVYLVKQKSSRVSTTAPDTVTEIATPEATAASKSASSSESSSSANQATAVLNNFQRSEIKNGKKIWEVKAERGEYDPQNGVVVLNGATLWFYKSETETYKILANKAIIHLVGNELKIADLQGAVRVYKDQITIETENAIYDKEKNTVTAAGPVQLRSAKADVSGIGLVADLNTKEVVITSEVVTLIKPRKSEN